jgi:isocitrate dehydrogenase (NAD+)
MWGHWKLPQAATRRRVALDLTLNLNQVRTRDLGGTASTGDFTKALIARIGRP